MTKLCLLITKVPHSPEDVERFCGVARKAREKDMDVSVYLTGDGVYCAKAGYKEGGVQEMVEKGVKIKVNGKDLKARALGGRTVEGVEVLDDFEERFVHETMEEADRVISW